jgi:cyanate permease
MVTVFNVVLLNVDALEVMLLMLPPTILTLLSISAFAVPPVIVTLPSVDANVTNINNIYRVIKDNRASDQQAKQNVVPCWRRVCAKSLEIMMELDNPFVIVILAWLQQAQTMSEHW